MKDSTWRNEHTYAEFDKIIRLFEKWIAGKQFTIHSYRQEVLRQRIVQRIVQLLFYPFGLRAVQKNKAGKYPFPIDGEKIELDNIRIDTATGKISINNKLTFELLADFLWQWMIALKAVTAGFFTQKKWQGTSTFVFGITLAEITLLGSEEPFIDFCRQGPVKPLAEAHRLVIQSPVKQKDASSFIQYTSYPVYEAVKRAELGFAKRIVLLFRHLFLPFRFVALVMRNRLTVLLAKDIIQAQFVSCLDKEGLIQSVIITNSDFFQQYIWMRQPESRSFKVHELHYSQNATSFVFKNDPFTANFPAFRHVKVDEHWVWTEGYKKHLEEMGHIGPVHVVGPILWYLPSEKKQIKQGRSLKLAVFDITPVNTTAVEKLGVMKYYYNTDLMIQFIYDILEASDTYTTKTGINIHVLLKSKRASKKGVHDDRYSAFIDTCEKENTNFSVLPFSENVFSFLADCDLSVSIPYTSVPYVSAYLEKPAIYFDPSGDLLFTNERSDFIFTASDKEELLEIFEKTLSA